MSAPISSSARFLLAGLAALVIRSGVRISLIFILLLRIPVLFSFQEVLVLQTTLGAMVIGGLFLVLDNLAVKLVCQ